MEPPVSMPRRLRHLNRIILRRVRRVNLERVRMSRANNRMPQRSSRATECPWQVLRLTIRSSREVRTTVTMVTSLEISRRAFVRCFSLADFSLNSLGGNNSENPNFLPWHTSSHSSLAAALQMNTLPLGYVVHSSLSFHEAFFSFQNDEL